MSSLHNQPVTPLVEPLTRREREIITLQAQGLSAPEIAQHLTLALSSVKFHIQNIYGKLGVNSKRQALTRAAELGLLETTPPAATPFVAARDGPPLAAAQAVLRHNLPLQLTNFIGRAQLIVDMKRQLRGVRLLTLTGPGGSGKTRLALQIAAEALNDFTHGVWLVKLAPIADPGLAPQAVAEALALRAETGQPFQQLLTEHMRDKSLLLVLDNCEHLVGACAALAEQLLQAAPRLRILATSREALGVAGENICLVPALSAPDPGQLPALEAVAQSEAVRLFVTRAQTVRPEFALTNATAPAVVRICQRLDGMPLAIELAAARAPALTVEQIAAHLDDRFNLLTGGNRTAPPRLHTLRGTIDWSYDLLSGAERLLFRRLAVFVGGWTLEAAEQMISGLNVLDLLTQLVAKSLVLSTQSPRQAARFNMLETIREYAQEKMALAGETESARGQHLAYYLALAETAEPELRGHSQVPWLKCLDRENDNLRAALAWAVNRNDTESAQRLAGALTYFWSIRSYTAEGRRWLSAALHLPTRPGSLGPSAWQARALLGAGWLGLENDPSPSQPWLEMALDIYRELGDKAGMAHTLFWSARHRFATQNDSAMALEAYQEALDLWMGIDDGWGVGNCLHMMGHAVGDMGNIAQAREFYERSVQIFREKGDGWQLMQPLGDLAFQAWLDGDAARALAAFEENLEAFEEIGINSSVIQWLNHLTYIPIMLGDYPRARVTALAIQSLPGSQQNVARGWVYLGQIDYLQGRLAEAQAHFDAALKIYGELGDQIGIGWVLPWLACVAYRLGDLDRAEALLTENEAIEDLDRDWAEISSALLSRGDVARAQGEPARAAQFYARSLQILVKLRNQPEVAERLEGFAKLAGAAHLSGRAARLLGAAAALRERIGIPIPAVERSDFVGAVALARTQLDETAFNAAWAEGLAMGWEQAAAYALET